MPRERLEWENGMTMLTLRIRIGGLLALSLLFTACSAPAPEDSRAEDTEPAQQEDAPDETEPGDDVSDTEGPIRVGILLPQTGPNAVFGELMTNGYLAAIGELNDTGGIAGRQIEYTIYDTVGDPQGGITAFRRFLADDLQYGLIGFSSVITAVAPLSEDEDVLLVNSGAPPFDPEPMGARTMHTLAGQSTEMSCAAALSNERGLERAAVLFADIEAYRAGAESFRNSFEELGGEVVGFETFEQGTPDFRSILSRVNRNNPDMVFLYSFGPDPGNIARQMVELGMEDDVAKVGWSGTVLAETPNVGGPAADGYIALAGHFDPSLEDEPTQRFIDSWGTHIDDAVEPETLGFYHATTYDGMMMLAEAMKREIETHNDLSDPSSVQQAFFEIREFEAATGTAIYEQEGYPVPTKPMQVYELLDGTWQPQGVFDC